MQILAYVPSFLLIPDKVDRKRCGPSRPADFLQFPDFLPSPAPSSSPTFYPFSDFTRPAVATPRVIPQFITVAIDVVRKRRPTRSSSSGFRKTLLDMKSGSVPLIRRFPRLRVMKTLRSPGYTKLPMVPCHLINLAMPEVRSPLTLNSVLH